MSAKDGTNSKKKKGAPETAPVASTPIQSPPEAPAQKAASFTDQDTEKLVEFLNFVATNAEFSKLDVKKMLQFTKLLNWFQTGLLPKMEAHKFEILSIKKQGTK